MIRVWGCSCVFRFSRTSNLRILAPHFCIIDTMATIDIKQSFKNLLAEQLGSAIIGTTGFWNNPDTRIIVLLTEELADHIIQMYHTTNWDELNEDDKCLINLPELEGSEELDEEALRANVGKHIIISLYGEPWPSILEAPAFVPGVNIDFPERMLQLLGSIMYSLSKEVGFDNLVYYLGHAALAMKADCVPDIYIRDIIKRELEKHLE